MENNKTIENAVEFNRVTKNFKLYKNNIERFSNLVFGMKRGRIRNGIKNVSFSVEKGESIAIIGTTGSGKSVTANLISGLYKPTEGEIAVNGKVTCITDMKNGMINDVSGRENLKICATLLGWSQSEIKERQDEIISYAELEKTIDVQSTQYEKGVLNRIGFAVQTYEKPEILVLDSTLIFDDNDFKEKCYAKLEGYAQDKDVTFLFFTNNLVLSKKICPRGIVMDDGEIVFDGKVDQAIAFLKKTVPNKKGNSKTIDDDGEDDNGSVMDSADTML